MVSTFLGLLPFVALGDQEVFWFALATGALGAMAASAVYVFVILPVMASTPARGVNRTKRRAAG
jgi:hypothetical protein